MVNGEILQILTYQQVSARKIGFKTFEICYGIKTLYRGFIDPEYNLGYFLTKDPSLYDEELVSRAVDYSVKFWNKERIGKLSYEFSRISYHFNPDFLTGMEIGRDIVAQGLVPIFEKTKNLENCIDYFYENRQSINFLLDDDHDPFMPSHSTSEALALIVADYRKDISQYLERELEFELRTHGLRTEEEFEALKVKFHDEKKMQINLRDRILDTPELKAKALDYAESVRQKNVEMLRGYGLNIDDNGNTVVSAPAKKAKSLSLNAAFKQVFGEYLEPLGYRFIKGKKYPVYVRVVSDEIVHIISIRKARSDYRGKLAFDIEGYPMTTYWSMLRQCIDGELEHIENNYDIYRQLMFRKKGVFIDFDFLDTVNPFYYDKGDEISLLSSMALALEISKKWLLAEISKAVDMQSYIRFVRISNANALNLSFAYDEDSGMLTKKGHRSLIIIREKYNDDDMWNVLEKCEAYSKQLKQQFKSSQMVYSSDITEEKYNEKMKIEYDKNNQYRLEQIALREKIFADEKLCKEISDELDRIKGESYEWLENELGKNVEMLKEYR